MDKGAHWSQRVRHNSATFTFQMQETLLNLLFNCLKELDRGLGPGSQILTEMTLYIRNTYMHGLAKMLFLFFLLNFLFCIVVEPINSVLIGSGE